MLQESIVCSKLHHLRVHKHKLQFRRMLGIQQRRNDDIKSHRLTLLGRTRNKKVRSISQVESLHFLSDCVSKGNRKFSLAVTEGRIVQSSLQRHYGRLAVRNLYTYRIRQCHDTYLLGAKRHSYLLAKTLDGRNLDTRCRHDLI